jgi:hypothetical protein
VNSSEEEGVRREDEKAAIESWTSNGDDDGKHECEMKVDPPFENGVPRGKTFRNKSV